MEVSLRLLVNFIWILSLTNSIVRCSVITSKELNAEEFLQIATKDIIPVLSELESFEWLGFNLFTSEDEMNFENARNRSINDIYELVHGVRNFDLETISNEEIRRQMKLISQYGWNNLNYSELTAANMLQEQMVFSTLSKNFFENARFMGDEALANYWTQFHDIFGNMAKDMFRDYVRFYQKAASSYESVLHMHYKYYEDPNFLEELTAVIEALRPLYEKAHYNVRTSFYGDSVKNVSSSEDPLRFDKVELLMGNYVARDLPLEGFRVVNSHLQKNNITSTKMLKIAGDFFSSLGLAVPNIFENGLKTAGPRSPCFNRVYNIHTGQKLENCPQADIFGYFDAFRSMTHLESLGYRKDLPFGLNFEPCPGFDAAIQFASILSGTSFNYSSEAGLFEDPKYHASVNYLMSIGTVMRIYQMFVNEKFFVDVITGKIEYENYNEAYWNLQKEIAGIVPPVDRDNTHFDVTPLFIRGLPDLGSRYIVGVVLGFQFYEAFCNMDETYKETGEPLHECNFAGNHKVGEVLREMLSIGSKKPWREIIRPVIPDAKLCAGPMLATVSLEKPQED